MSFPEIIEKPHDASPHTGCILRSAITGMQMHLENVIAISQSLSRPKTRENQKPNRPHDTFGADDVFPPKGSMGSGPQG